MSEFLLKTQPINLTARPIMKATGTHSLRTVIVCPVVIAAFAGISSLFSLPAAAEIIENFPVALSSWGVTFDGANIWTVGIGFQTVTKLRASDGAPLGKFPAGGGGYGATFDGDNIWVTNLFNNTVTKLQASDGTILGIFAVGTGPLGIIFDGTNIWVANRDSENVT